ncbi:coiled-coil domain-containing protein 55 [Arthroderma uncinatum]|uniref:coiled-coil domain-containing protein 55 n=1 Tax=Arthroderma uncinatum TaxID=74035 RepID=UPI00144A8445|nr:coiled-coil domain-containing protein 55 [Arthroderma uncinatum]KAF3480429.1 coiled-coil domain-containing protein 55 [Arthroderma uncinatum]
MAPPKLSYGLNLSKANSKKPSFSVFAGQKRKSLWDDPDSDEEGQKGDDNESNAVEITTLGGLSPFPAKSKPSSSAAEAPSKKKPATSQSSGTTKSKFSEAPAKREYTNLAALHSSKKHANEAESLDPSIYDYDAVYDSLHAKPKSKTNTSNDDPSAPAQGPKYMTALLRSADTRKRDQLRARDKLLAREREAEGDEFADKEKFVTAAYKAQQEEVRKIEAEEAEREKEEAEKRKKGMGMTGFYRDVLKRDEQRHEEVVKLAEEAVKNRATADKGMGEEEETKEKSATQIAEELNARGAKIAVNDEGEVVDKRQLLTAGLNVVSKPKPAAGVAGASRANAAATKNVGFDRGGIRAAREMQRARQTEMLTEQLEEKLRKEKEEEDARLRELAEKNKSQKSQTDVMSAKERYLARKREREKEKEKQKEGGA